MLEFLLGERKKPKRGTGEGEGENNKINLLGGKLPAGGRYYLCVLATGEGVIRRGRATKGREIEIEIERES